MNYLHDKAFLPKSSNKKLFIPFKGVRPYLENGIQAMLRCTYAKFGANAKSGYFC